MAQKSKAYRAAAEKIGTGKFYTANEAVGLARVTGSSRSRHAASIPPGRSATRAARSKMRGAMPSARTL